MLRFSVVQYLTMGARRGCWRPCANAVTAKPADGVGFHASSRVLMGAMLTVEISVDRGAGKSGRGPKPASEEDVEADEQAARLTIELMTRQQRIPKVRMSPLLKMIDH
jgi:hypothetical protein